MDIRLSEVGAMETNGRDEDCPKGGWPKSWDVLGHKCLKKKGRTNPKFAQRGSRVTQPDVLQTQSAVEAFLQIWVAGM